MARRHDLKGGVSVVRAEREANDPEADAVPTSKIVARLQAKIMARHPENDAIDEWIEAVYDWSAWK